jgi:hypothetical protein
LNIHGSPEKPAQTSLYVPALHIVTYLTFYLLSTAPDEDIQEAEKLYFKLGLSDVQIVNQLSDHYDTGQYGLRHVNFYFDGEPLAWCLIQVVLSHFADSYLTEKQAMQILPFMPVLQKIKTVSAILTR